MFARAAGAIGLDAIGYFGVGDVTLAGVSVHAARLSFVGEYGFEFTIPAQHAVKVYAALANAGARPCGTLAQTVR